jgi:hypothetical protein
MKGNSTAKSRGARDRTRIKRPLLPRSQPHREFRGIFGAADAADRMSTDGAAGKPTGLSTPPAEGVARGVNAGYRVIEEYLRQGQDLARSLWPGPSSGSTKNGTLGMTERMIRSASDLAGLVSEFLQTFGLPGGLPSPGSQPIPDFGISPPETPVAAPPSGGPAVAERTDRPLAQADGLRTVTIDIESKRRTEVTVDLKPNAWTKKLEVHDLRSEKATAPRLTGINAIGLPDEQRVVVKIRVPDQQPAGTYSGLIVDRDANLPQGMVSVRILDGRKGP